MKKVVAYFSMEIGLINDIPFFGFPFLRKHNTANSNSEIIELGKKIISNS